MPLVSFTANLKRFYPELTPRMYEGRTVAEVIESIDNKHPGLRGYILDDQGHLRQHVNIFIRNEMIRDKNSLSDLVDDEDEIHIIQALSGG